MEEIYHSKNQGYRRIKQGSYGNRTKTGRPKVTDIDYNTVAPFYNLGVCTAIILPFFYIILPSKSPSGCHSYFSFYWICTESTLATSPSPLLSEKNWHIFNLNQNFFLVIRTIHFLAFNRVCGGIWGVNDRKPIYFPETIIEDHSLRKTFLLKQFLIILKLTSLIDGYLK